jgi:periplasmic protein TonB
MMRLASFIILSVSLHAAALVYPLSFGGRSQAQLIQVTILPLEQEGGGSGSQRGSGNPTILRDNKSRRATPSVIESRIEAKSFANPAPEVLPANNVLTASNGSIALVSALENSADSFPAAISNSAGDATNVQDVGPGGTGSGLDSSGAGFGQGSGSGTGSGSSGTNGLTQARYRDTPRPEYPDSARREGSEGSVLLRVLVDEHGRSKKVEINSSSGSQALDRAAIEALRRWRFHPARYRDQAVESWLRVPIEFRLADAK